LLKLVLFFAVCATMACAKKTEGPEQWRFAIEETKGSVQDAYASKFEELIEERSNGEIDVTVYPYGTLGTSDQLTELLHSGTLEFAMASPGHLGKFIPEMQVFLLHFVFSEDERVNKRLLRDNPALQESLDALYADKGFKLLSVLAEGWQVWTMNDPVRSPEDFDGLKMRTMTSPLLLAAYDAYGASPTPLPYAEVYSALQLNMIDGQVNPVFAIEEMSFYEVCDYMIFPKHAQFFTTTITNREFYAGLSPERKKMVDETILELEDHMFEVQREFNERRLETIREKKPDMKVIELTAEERAALREASLPVREQYVEMVGPSGEKLLKQILAAVEKSEKKLRESQPN
jgi:tripartite ATP-independent transporter DctP family solute receptor